jgi:hypothetical protein
MNRRSAIEAAVRHFAPRIPRHEFMAVLDHALGSPGLARAAPAAAAWLSLVAYVRHALTEYDDLLADGYDAESARHFVREDINVVLESWGCRRHLSDDQDDSGP